jgi:hypothetical protein
VCGSQAAVAAIHRWHTDARYRPSAKAQLRELDYEKLSFDIGLQLLPDCGPGEPDIIAAIL